MLGADGEDERSANGSGDGAGEIDALDAVAGAPGGEDANANGDCDCGFDDAQAGGNEREGGPEGEERNGGKVKEFFWVWLGVGIAAGNGIEKENGV